MYYVEAFSQRKNNPRELWKLIKSVIPSKKTAHQPRKLLIENRVIEDPTEIAQHFNNYFSEIGKKIAQNSTDNTTNDTTFKKYLKKSVIHTIMLDPPNQSKSITPLIPLIYTKPMGTIIFHHISYDLVMKC